MTKQEFGNEINRLRARWGDRIYDMNTIKAIFGECQDLSANWLARTVTRFVSAQKPALLIEFREAAHIERKRTGHHQPLLPEPTESIFTVAQTKLLFCILSMVGDRKVKLQNDFVRDFTENLQAVIDRRDRSTATELLIDAAKWCGLQYGGGMMKINILGIDPGLKGAFVLLADSKPSLVATMPLTKEKDIDFEQVLDFLKHLPHKTHVYLERAMPMAMGSKSAFSYGRSFAALEIAIKLSKMPYTLIEPAKWSKTLHQGIGSDLKPKAKSRIAMERLFPDYLSVVPVSREGNYHEGVMEALLIAEFGRRQLGGAL